MAFGGLSGVCVSVSVYVLAIYQCDLLVLFLFLRFTLHTSHFFNSLQSCSLFSVLPSLAVFLHIWCEFSLCDVIVLTRHFESNVHTERRVFVSVFACNEYRGTHTPNTFRHTQRE